MNKPPHPEKKRVRRRTKKAPGSLAPAPRPAPETGSAIHPVNVAARNRLVIAKQTAVLTENALNQLRLLRRELSERNEAVAALQKELNQEHIRYAELFNMAPDGYVVTDALGVIREANRGAALMLGIPHPHLLGKPIINFVQMEDRQNLRRNLIRLREANSQIGTSEQVEFVRILPRGKEQFEASLRIAGIYSDQKKLLTGVRWLLRDMTERLRAENEQYQLLVDAVEDYAIFLLDEAGRVTSWNQGAQKILGYTEPEIIGAAYTTLFPDELGDTAAKELGAARALGRALEEEWMCRKNGERFFTQGVLLALPSGGANGRAGFAKILRDVTERRNMEEELRLREARMTLALQAAAAGTWQWDLDTNVVTWSDDYWSVCGLDKEKDLPSYESWKRSIHLDDVVAAEQVIAESIRTGDPIVNQYRLANPRPGGESWMLSLGHVLSDDTGRIYRLVGITMDITERKITEARLETRVQERTAELAIMNGVLQAEIAERERSEEERRDLTKRLATAQEEERRRISVELHDHMGQHLTAFALSLRVLEEVYPLDSGARPILARLREIADELGRDTHRLAVELRPTSLDDLGLAKALNGYLDSWSERTTIQTDFQATGFAENERMPRELETPLYRVAQEALNNVACHSGAKWVNVLLNRQADQVVLLVEDDGHGFDVDATLLANSKKPPEQQRLGLLGMQERVQLVGGTFTIESQPEGGTTLFVRLPCSWEKRIKQE